MASVQMTSKNGSSIIKIGDKEIKVKKKDIYIDGKIIKYVDGEPQIEKTTLKSKFILIGVTIGSVLSLFFNYLFSGLL